MAEELLIKKQEGQISQNGGFEKVVPLVIIRPSIIAAAFEEPFPGWTDKLGQLGSCYLSFGLGIIRDLPINPKLICDQIPVDFLSN